MIVDNIISEIINPLIRLLMGAGLVVFLWGIVEFLSSVSGGEKKDDGKRHMLWGIIGLSIMVAVFSIIDIIQNTIDSFG